jgi:hypothetical protein
MMDSVDGVILPKMNVDCFLNIVIKIEDLLTMDNTKEFKKMYDKSSGEEKKILDKFISMMMTIKQNLNLRDKLKK